METKIIIAVLISLITLLCCGKLKTNDTVKRLENKDKTAFQGLHPPTDELMKLGWVRNERIKNLTKAYNRYIEIAKDVDKCRVMKTSDSDEYVITLIDSRGRECSLWLTDGDKVRTITTY